MTRNGGQTEGRSTFYVWDSSCPLGKEAQALVRILPLNQVLLLFVWGKESGFLLVMDSGEVQVCSPCVHAGQQVWQRTLPLQLALPKVRSEEGNSNMPGITHTTDLQLQNVTSKLR